MSQICALSYVSSIFDSRLCDNEEGSAYFYTLMIMKCGLQMTDLILIHNKFDFLTAFSQQAGKDAVQKSKHCHVKKYSVSYLEQSE